MSEDAEMETPREDDGTAGMPRWVMISLMVVAGLIALFIALNVAGFGGQHGPGRHMGPDDGGHRTPMNHSPGSGMDHEP